MVPFLFLIYLVVMVFAFIYYVMKGDNLKNAWGRDTDSRNAMFFFGRSYQELFGENPSAPR